MVLRHDLVSQIPSLKKKYLKYENYKDQTITDMFTPDQLKNAIKLDAYQFASVVLLNDGQARFTAKVLPVEAQVSPVYGIEMADMDGDGNTDILLGGNLYRAKPEIGRYDASYGVFLKGDGKANFTPVPANESGVWINGEVRDITIVRTNKGEIILVARNNDSILSFKKK